VIETEQEEKLRMSVEMSLSEISTFDSELVTHITVPVLMNLLPDFSLSGDSLSDIVPYKLTLKTIQKLCTPPLIYEVIEQQLLKKFLLICGHSKSILNAIN
jgi:hypothetical protein